MTSYDLHVLHHRYHTIKQFEYYQNKYSKKPLKSTKCRMCFTQLKGKQKLFCSNSCRVQNSLIKKKFIELKKENPNLQSIFWKQTDNNDGTFSWNTIKGVENKPEYRIIKKIVTKKKPKSR